jgi:hypothetical protein
MTSHLKAIAIAIATLVIATPGFAEGAAKSPPVSKVAASLVRKINGTTCAYLPTSTKTTGLKNSWTAGTKKGPKGFITYSNTATFYKSKGMRYRTAFRQALSDSKAGSNNCSEVQNNWHHRCCLGNSSQDYQEINSYDGCLKGGNCWSVWNYTRR